MKTKNVVLTATLIGMLTANIFAQTYRNFKGQITSVFDSKPIAGALVTIIENADNTHTKSTYTDSQGNYTLDGIVGIKEEKEITIPEGTQSFGAEGKIAYYQKETGDAALNIYDILGRNIFEQTYRGMMRGLNSLNWNSNNVASGIYIYTIQTRDRTLTGKTRVLKQEKNFDIADALRSINQKEQREAQTARQEQAQRNTINASMQGTTGTPLEYTLRIEGSGIWGYQTTFIASQDTTINQTVKDKINMPANVMEKYNKLSRYDPRANGTVRSLTPLTVHFVVDTTDTVQKQFYEIFKQKAEIIKNAQINNTDPNYFKNKKFETGERYTDIPNNTHQIRFGDAGGYAAATGVEYNFQTGEVKRAFTIYEQSMPQNEAIYQFDVSFTKEVLTGDTRFGRNDDPDYVGKGLFNSGVTHEGKDFKNPIDPIMLIAHFMNPPNTKWDATKGMEIAPGWHNYLSKNSGTATLITLTAKDGTQYHTISNKPLEQAMKEYVK